MPLEAGAELRAQEGRSRAVPEARGKVIDDARAELRASEITIIVPDGGVAMVDGTSITDAALERKLAAAVKKNAAFKVKLSFAEKARTRAQAIQTIVKRSGATNVEISTAIVTQVPPQPPRAPDTSQAVVLAVAANGALTFESAAISDAALDKALAAAGKRTNKIVLTADKTTPYATIIKLMERAKAAGLNEIMFSAAP